MKALDRVIGYQKVKEQLLQILDMLNSSERYKKIGAKLPHGVLLYGEPGMGKTLLATSFIEDSGIRCFRNRDNGTSNIRKAFEEAAKEEKAIVFLDDMDKMSRSEWDTETASAIQAGIDSVKDKAVLVIATANDIKKLPDSLKRSGRFDRKIELTVPSRKDARAIVEYYLRKREVDPNANYEDISRMISYSSCADLDKIVNEAAIIAGYKQKSAVGTEDLVEAYLAGEFPIDEWEEKSFDERASACVHEAGHAAISEIIKKGSVGLVSARTHGGLTKRCIAPIRRPQLVLISLAGKASCELFDKGRVAGGCYSDLTNAYAYLEAGIAHNAIDGFNLLRPADSLALSLSESHKSKVEEAVTNDLERYFYLCKDILFKNKDFVLALASELSKKGVLLYSDIQAIRAKHVIVPCEYSEPDDGGDDSLNPEDFERRPIPDKDDIR